MALSTGKAALKTAMLQLANNTNKDKTSSQAIDEFIDSLEMFIKTASITVPGTGLVAPGGGGPVTGSSVTGTLS